MGTANGIKVISPETGNTAELNYAINPDDVNKFILTLFVNDEKELWIGTDGGGVYVYNLDTRRSRQLTKANGLPSNTVNSITKDSNQRILIATDKGLAFVSQDEPATIYCVNHCYGIEREYSARAVVSLQNKHILYGTSSGALILNPDNIQKSTILLSYISLELTVRYYDLDITNVLLIYITSASTFGINSTSYTNTKWETGNGASLQSSSISVSPI